MSAIFHGAVQALGRQMFLAVFPPGNELAAPCDGDVALLRAQDLVGHTLVTLPTGTSTRTLTDAVYDSLGVLQTGVVTTTQRDALVPLVMNHAGITFVPHRLALDAAAHGATVARPSEQFGRTLGLVFRQEARPPALAAFVATALSLKEKLDELPVTRLPGTPTPASNESSPVNSCG